ncbi:MAG: cytochrome c oxidase subunit 4 [Thermoleophilaceae bacterium]|nr:cytochrome c oxidase subunit 4 [Thermoleophilaceae bacterium]
MASEQQDEREIVPPAGERVHLPGPSYLPAVLALGASIAIIGVVISPVLLVIGGVVFLIALLRWVREARAEMAELPLDH